eukprot:TRINITY_DN9501_c1_g1_i13.p1 TRINITY_DN9501_c1_g1~~TRINITY_DN9501_c1_g1_i13.p1  ORF type:complete len:106 (-),score=14.83 TRINITY_DN9501_c1_g1_i13:175-492(-)
MTGEVNASFANNSGRWADQLQAILKETSEDGEAVAQKGEDREQADKMGQKEKASAHDGTGPLPGGSNPTQVNVGQTDHNDKMTGEVNASFASNSGRWADQRCRLS